MENITYNGKPISSNPVQPYKFHIQNIYYPDDIGEFDADQFEKYEGVVPVITNYYCDVINSQEFYQYRILIPHGSDSYYLTYLLKIGDSYYKPKKYAENVLNHWIDLVYSWTCSSSTSTSSSSSSTSMTPRKHKQEYSTVTRTVEFKKKIDENEITSILTPENVRHIERIGDSLVKVRCDCCKGAYVEHIPDLFVLKTEAEYRHKHKHENIHVQIDDYHHRQSFRISFIKYFSCNLHYDQKNDEFGIYGEDVLNHIHFDFTGNYISISAVAGLLSDADGMLFIENGSRIIFGRGKYFVSYSEHDTFYYPSFVNDDTIWMYHSSRGISLVNDMTNYTDLSGNTKARRLFEIFDVLKSLIAEKLHNGRNEYADSAVRYNGLVTLEQLQDEFENFMQDTRLISLKHELTTMIVDLKITDFLPYVISEKYRELYNYYLENCPINSPHVFIIEGYTKSYMLKTVVNQHMIIYETDDKEKLFDIANTTWASRVKVYISDEDRENLIDVQITKRDEWSHPDWAKFDELVELGKIQKHVGKPYVSKLTGKRAELLKNMFGQVFSSNTTE